MQRAHSRFAKEMREMMKEREKFHTLRMQVDLARRKYDIEAAAAEKLKQMSRSPPEKQDAATDPKTVDCVVLTSDSE